MPMIRQVGCGKTWSPVEKGGMKANERGWQAEYSPDGIGLLAAILEKQAGGVCDMVMQIEGNRRKVRTTWTAIGQLESTDPGGL